MCGFKLCVKILQNSSDDDAVVKVPQRSLALVWKRSNLSA